MFGNLLKSLLGETAPPQPEFDHPEATAALLVRCARVDDHYDRDEVDMIDRVLAALHAIPPEGADALRKTGEQLEKTVGDTVHLTKVIKDGVPYDQRISLIEALWQIVLADEERAAEENAFLRLTSSLLGVNDRDSGLARQRVLANR